MNERLSAIKKKIRQQKIKNVIRDVQIFIAVALCCISSPYVTKQTDAADTSFFNNKKTEIQKGDDIPLMKNQASKVSVFSLNKDERAWLRDHPVIRVVQDPGWPPIEFVNEQGEFSGMAGDYLELIEKRLGITFERVRNLSWQEAYARLKRWEIDMTTSVAATPEREKFWTFTKPYMKIPIVIFTQMNVTYIPGMEELSGKKVAVVDGYAVNDWIPRDFPDIQMVKVKTYKEGFDLLQKGDVFAYIDNMLVVDYFMTKFRVTNVKIAGQTPYVNAQSMAVRKDWAILAGILQKALDSISEKERAEIYHKWVPIRHEHEPDYNLLWQALALFILIVLGLVAWNRKLSREIKYRKAAEAALSISEKRFRQLFNAASVPMCLVSKEGTLVDFNRHFVQLFGYSHEEIPTIDKWWQFACPDPNYRHNVTEAWEAAVRRSIEEGADIKSSEYQITCQNGEARTIVISGAIIGGNTLITFFDVSDRKQAEEALQLSEKRLAEAQRVAHIGNHEYDIRTNKLYLSEEAFQIFGISSRDFTSNVETFFECFHPDDRKWVRQTIKEIIATTGSGEFEHRIVRPDGSVRIVHQRFEAIYENSKPVRYFGTIQDITDRKWATRELLRLNRELEQRVAERTKALSDSQLALLNVVDDLNQHSKILEAANKGMEAANKELEAFAYSISHDLRAPLRALDGYSRILMEDFGPRLDEEGKRVCSVISESALNMGRLIDDLLAFSRIGRTAMEPSSVDMATLANSIFFELTTSEDRERIDFHVGPLPQAQSDPTMIRQVWMNLLSNAIKFSSKKERAVIEVSGEHLEEGVVYSVRDNGAGFDMRYADKLFGVFQRLHSAKDFEGTGVGLAIVQRIVFRHGGRVWAEGENGRGATFHFTLEKGE